MARMPRVSRAHAGQHGPGGAARSRRRGHQLAPQRIRSATLRPRGKLRGLRRESSASNISPNGCSGSSETSTSTDGHGAARHHHVRAKGPALGRKKLPAPAEGVEYIPDDGGVELLPQQLKQLGVIFPFHASSSAVSQGKLAPPTAQDRLFTRKSVIASPRQSSISKPIRLSSVNASGCCPHLNVAPSCRAARAGLKRLRKKPA